MIKRWLTVFLLTVIVFCIGLQPTTLHAQSNDSDDIEVYLDFRHRGVINSVIISYYKNDEFFLPVSELFTLFNIDHTVNGLVIEGKFGIEQIPYRINFQANRIIFGETTTEISADDYLLKEIDSYLRADVFYEAFGLDFTIDFNNLTLNLQTDRELPAVVQAIRRQRRQIADENRFQEVRYDLRYDRERPFLDGGFVDYNFSANVNPSQNVYNLNTNLGMQVYGGDLQGSIFGSYSRNFSSFATDNLRWRYMYRDQPWLSKLTIGQTTTDGFSRNAYTGIRLSNEPIEPRRLFDEYEIQGSTIPQSEVELYMNNALIDFQQADELGNYRFLTPITYGSSQLDLKIYGPTGQIIERSERIQIPFTFQPEGVFNYTFNAGQLDNPIFGSIDQTFTAQGSGAYGITEWLTAKAGVEYYEGYHDALPSFTSTLSSRILTNYILTVEAATNAYYRGIINVIYPNSASFNVDYTEFTGGFGIYNPSNDDKRLVASAFYPFNFGGFPFNLRASTFSRIRSNSNSTTFRVDANSRFGKLNLRLGYSDRYADDFNILNPTNTAYLETSATYNVSRNRNLPSYLRGVFLRAQMRYQPTFNQVESAEFLISQNVLQNGRLQLAFGRNFTGDFNSLRFNLIVDLNTLRSSTTFSNIRGSSNFTENIRGSVGYDSNYNNVIFTSRDQVGRSGTAVQLFVDNDADGGFNDGDDAIEANAVRILRSGATTVTKNGILYFTQMQPYYYYNLEMNKSAIKNPMLVPEFDKFGLITDPNRFKKVEIPFYMSGVVEGIAERQFENGNKAGVAGLKILLNQKNGDFNKELRTFSDGSFYDYEVPPGTYELEVDSSQLDILKSKSIPEKIEFEVQPSPEGDFVEGLSFLLIPAGMTQEELQQIADAKKATSQPKTDTSDRSEQPENVAVQDTSGSVVVSEDQEIKDKTGDQSDAQQEEVDRDAVETGLPPVLPPITLPIIPETGGVADLDADSAQTDSLPQVTLEDPLADVFEEPVQIPDSSTSVTTDLNDMPADSAIALVEEVIDSEAEDLIQPEDSLGVEPDVEIEGGILPPAITPISPPILPVIDGVADIDADSIQIDSLPEAIVSDPMADQLFEPGQIPDSATTDINDLGEIPADSTIAAIQDDIDLEAEDLILPEDSLGVEPEVTIKKGVLPPVVTAPDLMDRDSLQISPLDSTIAELPPDTSQALKEAPIKWVRTATDAIPTAFSSDEDLESLNPGRCIYGIQFASYSKESQADNLSRKLEEDYQTFIIYNSPYNLYGLREIQYQSLSQVTSATKELNTSYDFDAAVISQCYADLDLIPETTTYYIQIAEFATEKNAQSYLRDLKEVKGITAAEIPGDRFGVRIGIGPFGSERKAAERLQELKDDLDNYANASIRRYTPTVKVTNLNFEFLLLLDEFSTEEQAFAYRSRVENFISLDMKILLDENEDAYIVATELMKSWSRINNLKDRLVNSGISEEPVILMVEIKK